MKTRRLALEGVIMIVTIAMRLTPLERDLLAAGLFALQQKLRPRENPHNQFWGHSSKGNEQQSPTKRDHNPLPKPVDERPLTSELAAIPNQDAG